jgi:hypothetical protein
MQTGTIEHYNHLNLRQFTRCTMLTDIPKNIAPHTHLSWIMVVKSNDYIREFTVSCADALEHEHIFRVHMPDNTTLIHRMHA